MAVPKKSNSISKKRIRKNIWKKKIYWAALKAFSLAKSLPSHKLPYHLKEDTERGGSMKRCSAVVSSR
ncbi:hypothetical protein ACJRO7_016011 [Eucalyptus globulus]|uniref:Large ribosomal subunit protein bL32c n=1 Tax=Eucalyptus globulus TaxID=34317 RepID=A0ABD3L992_EUCGL